MKEVKKKVEYQPPQFIEFISDGTKAELIPNPPLTPKGTYTYKYYFTPHKFSTIVGTTIPFDKETIDILFKRDTIKVLPTR